MGILIISSSVLLALFGYLIIQTERCRVREIARLRGSKIRLIDDISHRWESFVASCAENVANDVSIAGHRSEGEEALLRDFTDAGLETAYDRGLYLLARSVGQAFAVLGFLVFLSMMRLVPALCCTAVLTIFVLAAPRYWLKVKRARRVSQIQRELPLVIDLAALGSSAGWDVGSALEHAIDGLHAEIPDHPLIREMNRARWLTSAGYTWPEALLWVAERVDETGVQSAMRLIAQSIYQGGDRKRQLAEVGHDVLEVWHTSIDRELSSMPLKGLLLTVMVVLACVLMLRAQELAMFITW